MGNISRATRIKLGPVKRARSRFSEITPGKRQIDQSRTPSTALTTRVPLDRTDAGMSPWAALEREMGANGWRAITKA